MMQGAAYGRLCRDPEARQTKTGTTMATCSMAVDVEAGEGAKPLWLRITCFGKQAEALLRCQKGDPISASGRVERNRWVGQDGTEREQLRLVVDAIVTARTVRPGGGKARQAAQFQAPL